MSTAPQPSAPPPTSGLAIAALVCTFLCWPIGLVLGIIALVKINNSNGAMGGRTLAIVSVALSALAIPAMGVMAAIAVPNFVRYQNRSKASEAKMNLAMLRVGQEAKFADIGRYLRADAAGNTPDTVRGAWDAPPCSPSCTPEGGDCSGFGCLDFQPMSNVFYRYACEVNAKADAYACAALGDLDGDGEYGLYVIVGGEGEPPAIPDFGGRSPSCGAVTPGEVVDCQPGVF